MNEFWNVKRLKDETDFEFCLRVCMAKANKEIDADWGEIVEAFNLGVHSDTLRKNFVGPMGVKHIVDYYDEKLLKQIQDGKSQSEKDLDNKIHQLYMEKQKLKDERSALNKLLRTEARWQNVIDMLEQSVKQYEPVPATKVKDIKSNDKKVEACLMLSDWHIGSEFDTFIETFNMDIAKQRINYLKKSTKEYCQLHNVQTLYIEMLGDFVSGIIHIGNRLAQCENIVDQTVLASELLGDLIYDLSSLVPEIKLVYCVGNHGRVNADVKESIAEENFEYLIKYYLTVKLNKIENIEWLENEVTKEMCIYTLDNGKTIASVHGHREKRSTYQHAVKNITDFSEQFRVDEVHMGHFHNHQVINNVIVNGSLMGCDTYAQNFKYHSVPSQVLRIYDENENVVTYEIKLK